MSDLSIDAVNEPIPPGLRRQRRRPNGAAVRTLSVRLPADLHAAFEAAAHNNGETMSAAVVDHVRRYVKRSKS